MNGNETTSTNGVVGGEEYKYLDVLEIYSGIGLEILDTDEWETLVEYGSNYLSIQDLLSILISDGDKKKAEKVINNLLKAFDCNIIDVLTASIYQLTQVEGIGIREACKIKAAFEFGKKINSISRGVTPKVTSKNDVVRLMSPHMKFLKQEEFRILLLNSHQELIRIQTVAIGVLDAAIVEPASVFRPAIAIGAKSIVVVHNHPSGDPTPSEQDIIMTQQLCMCGKLMGIEILDHVIIGFSDHVSLREMNLIPE